jgi:hypothetical protein
MGVAPEAIVEKNILSSIGSRNNIARHTSTRNSLPAKFFNSRYFQEHLVVEFKLTTSSQPPRLKSKNLSHISCICRRHPFTFIQLFYRVNNDVALHQCKPFDGYHCNFCDFCDRLTGCTIFDHWWAAVSDLCATFQPTILLPEDI